MTEKKLKPPKIPIAPMLNMIVIDQIKVVSKIEKKQKEKNPKVIMTDDTVKKMIDDTLESTHNILDVYDEHPYCGIIVAIGANVRNETGYDIGDKVAFKIAGSQPNILVFNKRKYLGVFAHDILFRYLTNEV